MRGPLRDPVPPASPSPHLSPAYGGEEPKATGIIPVLPILIFLLLTGPAAAQVALPLGGYVRAGKCMPVNVKDPVRQLRAEGGVPTHLEEGMTGVVPVLILTDSPGPLRAGSAEYPLRPLTPDQRLVGMAVTDMSLAGALFPEMTIIPIQLDASAPLPGPAIAWEALDAVILDSAPGNLDELLGLGITLAIRSPPAADTPWPWERVGDAWVLRGHLAGPVGSIGGDVAFIPSQAWSPGRPEALRRQIMLVAALVLLLLMSPLLIRGKKAVAVMLMVAFLCAAAIEFWRRNLPKMSGITGAIIVQSPRLSQYDNWTWFAAGSPGGEGVTTLDRPIVASTAHAAMVNLRMEVNRADGVRWRFRLPGRARLATRLRMIIPRMEIPAIERPITSPMHELARQAYLSPGSDTSGQVPAEGAWPSVVIRRP